MKNEILENFKMLAMSQGFYGRMLRQISEMDADTSERLVKWMQIHQKDFGDTVDMVLFLES
jgi:hypothetical protein